MSSLLLKRTRFNSICTQGELYVDGDLACYTLEPPKEQPPVKPRAIPPGSYDFIFTESAKLGYVTPLLEAVPDFDEIRIHKGNFPSDTEGCILVGRNLGTNAIYNSGEAFNVLVQEIQPGTIEIVEQPVPLASESGSEPAES